MKKSSVITGGAVLMALAAAGLLYYLLSGSGGEVQYRVDKVSRGDIHMVVTATGTLNAVTTVKVGTQISGIISKIKTDFNQPVKKNQVIALIDPTTLQEAVRDADANRQKAVAEEAESKRTLDRLTALLNRNLVAQAEYDSALVQYESNKAAKTQADAQYESAVINLDHATIRSPIDGVVISRQVDVGQTVAASFSSPTLFTIANDLTKMQVLANVDEADIGKVHTGQSVSFSVDAYPDRTFWGSVSQVRLAPDTVQNVVDYVVVIDVPNNDKKLMPGMTATVTVMVQDREGVLKVPTTALRFQPPEDQIEPGKDGTPQVKKDSASSHREFADRVPQSTNRIGSSAIAPVQSTVGEGRISRVWVVNKDQKLEPIVVRVGISDGTYTEVSSGMIAEGLQIVTGVVAQKSHS
jgi:HlyD family secretion protein